ncbi:unnamed protein product [Phaeothamnion confervicola]
MTIRRGEAWGEIASLTPAVRRVHGDTGLHEWLQAAMTWPVVERVVAVASGDLARTLGGGTHGRLDGPVLRAPIDVVEVIAGDESVWCASHVVARRSWWRGEVVLSMNAQFLGERDIAPRSHPNDGKVDVLRVDPSMPVRARRQAAARARTGSHLPHPHLSMRSVAEVSLTFERPLVIWVDGVRWGSFPELALRVRSDAITVYA